MALLGHIGDAVRRPPVKARTPGNHKLKAITDAYGSYVRVRPVRQFAGFHAVRTITARKLPWYKLRVVRVNGEIWRAI